MTDTAEQHGNHVAGTSFNAIAALSIKGETICGITKQTFEKGKEKKDLTTSDLKQLRNSDLVELEKELKLENLCLLVIDEVSTCSSETLASLDNTICQLTQCHDKPFGGIPTLLIGDFFQLPPVFGNSLPKDVMTMAKKDKN